MIDVAAHQLDALQATPGFWQDRNVLITGATGFVGRWLVRVLLRLDANPIVILRDLTSNRLDQFWNTEGSNHVQCVIGDISDLKNVSRTFSDYEIEFCFHLAAQTIVRIARRSPVFTFEPNVRGTWNILEGARRHETCKGLILASTDKVYGEPQVVPIPEDHPLLGVHPYDSSKVCAEIITRSYFKTYGIDVATARCSNIYGGADTNYSRIVPGAMRAVVFNRNPVIRGDGKSTRDFLYIDDAVEAYLTLAENLGKANTRGEAFNFGTSTPTAVLDLVRKVIDVSGNQSLTPEILGLQENEIRVEYLAIAKAKSVLNWEPKVGLDEGLAGTYGWYRENLVPSLRMKVPLQ
jgi:CDP-glucose 4,6-dehydratase